MNNQAEINFKFLLKVIDIVHMNLCPDKMGTWQDRAYQIIEESKNIKELRSTINDLE